MAIKEGNKKDHFNALTGIRGVLATCIFLNHYNHFSKPICDFVNELYLTLPAFFVLSGFLITYRYYNQVQIGIRKYIINRVARIYPIYFFLTTLTFIVWAISEEKNHFHDLVLYVANITFVRGLFDNMKFSGIAQGWSLTVEEVFYFSAPLLFFFIKKNKYSLIIFPVIFFIMGLGLVQLAAKLHAGSFFDSNYFMIGYTFFGRSFEFFVGISLALFLHRYGATIKTRWCTYTGLVIFFISLYVLSRLKLHYNFDFGYRHPLGILITNVLTPLFSISIFYWGLIKEKTIIQTFLGSRIMVLLGKSSYVFYLIHLGVIHIFLEKFSNNSLVLFILLQLISIVLFSLVEEPINLFLRKRLTNIKMYEFLKVRSKHSFN